MTDIGSKVAGRVGENGLCNGGVNDIIEIKHEVVDLDVEPQLVVAAPVEEIAVVNESNGCDCSVEKLLTEPYSERDFSRTLELIRKGRPKPLIPLQKDSQTSRLFRDHYYDVVDWLTGCLALGRLYCWPCLLFDRAPGLWNQAGFEDISNFHKAYKRHENSQNHIVASMQLVAFLLNHCERTRYDSGELNVAIRSNREALKRVIESVCAAGIGHPAGINTRQLLFMARRQNLTLSSVPQLHIDVVKSISSALLESISERMKDSLFVSLFLDEIQGRIAAVFRYTNFKGELCDSFVGFMEGTDIGGVVNCLKSKFDLKGRLAAVLLGATSRAETLPDDPNLTVLHSPAHRMSYVLPFALQHIKECASFFHVVHCFESWLKDNQVEDTVKTRLPNSNVLKWRERPVTALYEQKELIQDIVHAVLDKPNAWQTSPYTTALVLQHALKDLEFTFLLRVFKELFPVADALLDMIVNNSPNVKVCSETVVDYLKVLNWKKEKFTEIWESIQEADLDGPASKKPRHGGTSKLLAYYRSLYESIVDALVAQVRLRFSSLAYLEFAELIEINRTDQVAISEKHIMMLRNKRDCFDLNRLRNELVVSYAQVDFKGLQCDQLLRHLNDTGLGQPLRQVRRLARMILVYPYASRTNCDSCTRLFSNIHDFARRISVDANWLQWATISLENRLINELVLTSSFMEKAVTSFAEEHPHRQRNISKSTLTIR